MTITQDPSAPLVAVVGATGRQGGSVVQALIESDKAYRIRAFTRDGEKPEARALAALGVDIVVLSLVVANKDAVFDAFRGADYGFLVTNYWEHGDKEKETAEGKLLVDAAKAGGVKGIVWSGLPRVSEITSGKFTNVDHYESKALVTAYGRGSGVPFVDVQTGFYNSNFLIPLMGPMKQPDGSYAVSWPVKPTTRLPFIDIVRDYGLFVRRVLETDVFPDGEVVVTYGEVLSLAELAKQFSEGASASSQGEPIELTPCRQRRVRL
ncbi:NAD(P)-binding protein [Roridomyces roridus]|uniref:NAD(P)-binding protein n=1 Tax=Roridomyces roridus TaxID=1738132 RepID=A0AAD7BHG4_9AGAR|nr:NAD(P)-binding protein [Roridomyces roridus]